MADETLQLSFDQIAARVGNYLGWGRGAVYGEPEWESYQANTIDEDVGSGCRNFYFQSGYDWSFLRPMLDVDLPQSSDEVLLPEDFGGIEGDVYVTATGGQVGWQVQVQNEGRIQQQYTFSPNATGRPIYAAVAQPKSGSNASGGRSYLKVWPLSDQDYTLSFQYYYAPKMLKTGRPYAVGGPQHHETIMLACLAAAELHQDNKLTVYKNAYDQALVASKEYDRKLKPQFQGYNGDRSIARWSGQREWFNRAGWPRITINGVSPE